MEGDQSLAVDSRKVGQMAGTNLRTKRAGALLVIAAAVGCGGSSADGPPPSTTSTISGMVTAGRPFNNVATAYWIGKPDFAESTVVMMFEMPIRCSEISMMAWDAMHGSSNQVLEMKLGIPTKGGALPMTFNVRMPNPMGSVAPGEADVSHTLFAMAPQVPVEDHPTAGTITITTKTDGGSLAGTFDMTFPQTGSLRGSIDATFCPTGVEP